MEENLIVEIVLFVMDLLCNAYSNTSDEDDDEAKWSIQIPTSKRPKPEIPNLYSFPRPNLPLQIQTQASLPGRYISKRERAILGANPASVPLVDPNHVAFTSSGSISISDIPHDRLSQLRCQARDRSQLAQLPEKLSQALNGHSNVVNSLHWSPNHAHLLASAGMDHMVCIWNIWSQDQKKARILNFHKASVKDVKWSRKGHSVISCGYDCASRFVDVEKGMETQIFHEDQVVGVVKFHPENSNLILSGGLKGHIRLWDIRTSKVIHTFTRNLGPILDVEFSIDGKQFISSSDVSGSNISENSIIVWDISRQIPLSNQIYVEAYTCPSVRCHPSDPIFIAQSNGNYVALFSSTPPFKLNKYKRYEGHGVSGFPIKCNFSLDGQKIASGSSDGSIYIYNYKSSEMVRKIKVYDQPCLDVAFHPTLPNVMASSCWNGSISIHE